MTTTFLIISFLIHILLLYAVYHLFQQLEIQKTEHKAELNSLLTGFIQEMKAENERFEQKLSNHKPVEKEVVTDKVQESYGQALQEEESFIDYDKLLDKIEKDEKIETSLEAQVFKLHEEGKSIEEIARQTNSGKTEVSLLLKLSNKPGVNT